MIIIGVTGKFGSGKSYFSNELGKKLDNSKVINVDHIFFELLNSDENIKNQVIKMYGQNAYNMHGDIELSIIQKDEKAFENIYDICKGEMNKKIINIIDSEKRMNCENLVFEWFMLPKTIAFDKSDIKILVEPNDEDREKNLMSRDSSYTPSIIHKKDSLLKINYNDFEYDETVKHSYKKWEIDDYTEKLKETIEKQNNKDVDEPQYLYHQTTIERVKSIHKKGLDPRVGENCKFVNDEKEKVSFSEGMKGTIAISCRFQHHYDEIKGKKELTENEKGVKKFIESQKVLLRFSSEGINNENDNELKEKSFMDGWTTKKVESEKIKVCLLKNKETGEITYNQDDILKYMMAITPIQEFKDNTEWLKWLKEDLGKYYKKRSKELSEFDASKYSLEDIDIEKFIIKQQEKVQSALDKQQQIKQQEAQIAELKRIRNKE